MNNPEQSVREQQKVQIRRFLNDAFDNNSLNLTANKVLALIDQISAERAKEARVDEVGRYGQWLIAHADIPNAMTLMQYKVDRLAQLTKDTRIRSEEEGK